MAKCVHSRRDFLRGGLILAPFAATMPGFLVRAAFGGVGSSVKNLILVELAGGNDGLNTLVPYGLNGGSYYTEFRPTIGIPEASLLKIDASHGFNPSLATLKARYDAGKVAIVQGVGYPNANFSHEISAQIWAKGDPLAAAPTGWVARLLSQFAAPAFPNAMDVSDWTNLAFSGASEFVPAFSWLGSFEFPIDGWHWSDGDNRRTAYETIVNSIPPGAPGAPLGPIAKMSDTGKNLLTLIDTFDGVPELDYVGDYPDDWFSDRMKLVARLMNANLGLRIFHVGEGGFDTHSEQDQDSYHTNLIGRVFDGIDALLVDVAAMGKLADTVVVVYSEFGRTVYENGSTGTDHGTVNPVFVLGGPVSGGVKNAHPPLDPTLLDDDNEQAMQADFRDVFAEIGTKLYGVGAATLFPGYSPTSFGVLT